MTMTVVLGMVPLKWNLGKKDQDELLNSQIFKIETNKK